MQKYGDCVRQAEVSLMMIGLQNIRWTSNSILDLLIPLTLTCVRSFA